MKNKNALGCGCATSPRVFQCVPRGGSDLVAYNRQLYVFTTVIFSWPSEHLPDNIQIISIIARSSESKPTR